MRNRTNKDRKPKLRRILLSPLLFFIIHLLLLVCAIVLITNNRVYLSQIFPSGSKDQPKHFLDRVAKEIVFSENPIEFSTNKYFTNEYNEYYDTYLLSSNTQTDCQYGGSTHKCNVRIYIGLNINNRNTDNTHVEFAIKDLQDNKYYETTGNVLVHNLYFTHFTNETKDELVFYGRIYGFIEYRSEDETKKIYFSPTVKFIIPMNDSKKDEFIQRYEIR